MGCWFTTNHQRSPWFLWASTHDYRTQTGEKCFYFGTPCNTSRSIVRQEAVVRKWPTLSEMRRVLVLKKKETGQWRRPQTVKSSAETKLRQNLRENRHFLFQLINISSSKKHLRTCLIRPLFYVMFLCFVLQITPSSRCSAAAVLFRPGTVQSHVTNKTL